jgi:hypothetical protein
MKILLMMAVVQSLNLVIFAWFNRVAGLRILVLRQQLTVYKRKSKKPIGKRVSCRSAYDSWLWQEMGIGGIPIPYGAPNAAAHIERLIGTLRREFLDRIVIWNEQHLRSVLRELISRSSYGRVHQGVNGIPDPDPAIDGPKPLGGRLVARLGFVTIRDANESLSLASRSIELNAN